MIILIKKHIFYYCSLVLILAVGGLFALQVSYDRSLQMTIVTLTVILYVIWGILHHIINHDITSKIVIEYVLMGSLGLSIVLFLLRS